MFEVFKIGFLTIWFSDIIDILLVAYIIYRVYNLIKGTIAAQIFLGLVLILVLSIVSQALNFKALGWLLNIITDTWVIAFIILFQPELRRLLLLVGRSPFMGLFVKSDKQNIASILTDAAFELSQLQHGALIVIVKSTGIRTFSETGEMLNSKLTKNLIKSIFYPRSPLHDGAVIVKGDVIEAARCTLPLSSTTVIDGQTLGMRHRAGLGITEQADVLSLIVSEETGSISIAENGKMIKGLSKDKLKDKLNEALSAPKQKGLWSFFKTEEDKEN